MGYFVIQGMYCPQILQAAQAALFECAFFMKISVIIPTLNGEKQLDQLFLGDAMDITTDVEVLERMLKKDGLSGDGTVLQI